MSANDLTKSIPSKGKARVVCVFQGGARGEGRGARGEERGRSLYFREEQGARGEGRGARGEGRGRNLICISGRSEGKEKKANNKERKSGEGSIGWLQ